MHKRFESRKKGIPNWLPTAKSGVFGMTMRLYTPRPAALSGEWFPPAVKKVE